MKPILALSLLALSACGQGTDNTTAALAAPAANVAPPAGGDWTTTVSKTAEGGMLMGNPNAAVKLVEYASFTCPHCAEFSETAAGPIKAQVATGKMSFESRNYIRDPIDVTATLLARCAGPGPYFLLSEQMYAEQKNWFARMQAAGEAQFQSIAALPPAQQFARYAALTGLGEFVQQRGVTAAQASACLADTKAAEELVAVQKKANDDYQIPGTPTFLINGRVVPGAASWETLQPALKSAGI